MFSDSLKVDPQLGLAFDISASQSWDAACASVQHC